MAHIYISDPSTAELISSWCKSADYDYVSKFKKEHRRKQSLAARCLVRMLHALFWGKGDHDLIIKMDENGQPHIQPSDQNKRMWISIAHSNDCACALISDQAHIGIDVEFIKADRDITTLIQRLYPNFNSDRTTAYKFWTLNEAYAKAKGTGLDFSKADALYQSLTSEGKSDIDFQFTFIEKDDYIFSIYCM